MKYGDMKKIVKAGVRSSRIAPGLVVTNNPGRDGLTEWKEGKVTRIVTSLGDTPQQRTVRIHEMLHANRTDPNIKCPFGEMVANLVEDVFVHSDYWPESLPREAHEDALLTADEELDMISASLDDIWEDKELRDHALYAAVRCLSIGDKLQHYDGGETLKKACSLLSRGFGEREAYLAANMISTSNRSTRWVLADKLFKRDFERPEHREDDVELEDEVEQGPGGRRHGGKIEIVHPKRHIPCNAFRAPRSAARSGAVIRAGRLGRAIVNGSTSGLFYKTGSNPGGSVLIDASGSMNFTAETLQKICDGAPSATLAYYSGNSGGCDYLGKIVVHAKDGKRAKGLVGVYGNNDIDYWAIKWLLKQPAPRAMFTDCGFCGGPEGQDEAAHDLLRWAVEKGEIMLHKTVDVFSDRNKVFYETDRP